MKNILLPNDEAGQEAPPRFVELLSGRVTHAPARSAIPVFTAC